MSRYPTLTRNDRRNRWERIVAAYRQGACSRTIAQAFGMNDSHVRAIVRMAGVQRPPGRRV